MKAWKCAIAAGLLLPGHAAAAVLWEPQTAEVAAKLTRADYVPGSGFAIAFEAPPGSYQVTFSQSLDLPPWQSLATLNSATGQAAYLDTTAASRERGFYRVEGGFTSTAYHSIAPGFAVESGFALNNGVGRRGDLLCEISAADVRLEHQGVIAGLMRFQNAAFIQQFIGPEISDLSAIQGEGRNGVDPFSFTPAGWQSTIPAGPYPLLYGQAFGEISTFPFHSMESGQASMAAVGLRSYQGSVDPESGDPQPFKGRKLELPILIQKSTDADAEDLNGSWGIVTLAVRGELTDPGGGLPPTLPGHIDYSVSSAVAEIAATSITESLLTISRESSSGARHSFEPAQAISTDSDESLEARSFEMVLASDGAVTFLDVPQAETDPLQGAVSPTASLLVVARARPSADPVFGDSGQSNTFFNTGATTESMLAIAVRREINPQLAGRAYRAFRLGFFVSSGSFEISHWLPKAMVTINQGATAASISATQALYSVTFDGFYQSESLVPGGVHALQVAPDGMVSLVAALPNSRESRYTGFAQAGADLIILGGAVSGSSGSAEISLMILIADN